MQTVFGAGALYGIPLTDASGNAIATNLATPVRFGVLQECSLDVSFDTKQLYGDKQFAVALGRGKGKISGKAKAANIAGALMNSLLFGQTLTPLLQNMVSIDEGPSAIPTTPFQITVSNSATWTNDLGVFNNATGLPLKRVASAPAAGQYTVVAGVYTFSSADNVSAISVRISYGYTLATGGNKSTVSNLLMGYAPSFRVDLSLPFQGKNLIVTLPNCVSNKFNFNTKQDDFMIPELAFDAFADAAGNVITYSLTE